MNNLSDLFKALGNANRRAMIKLLMQQDFHISGIAKELNIAVPVALKHTNILEEVGLIERNIVGNAHILSIKKESLSKIEKVSEMFEESFNISVEKNTNILDALKKVSGIKIEKTKDGTLISSVYGKPGYYIYEVNGKLPDTPVDKYFVKTDVEIELKRLLPVIGKKIKIKVK